MEMKEKVYYYLTLIPKGKVVTYKQIATWLGNPRLCRVVGNILHVNPDPDGHPCFKVVNSKGGLASNFGLPGKAEEQKRRLINDGVEVIDYKVDLKKYQWDGKKEEDK